MKTAVELTRSSAPVSPSHAALTHFRMKCSAWMNRKQKLPLITDSKQHSSRGRAVLRPRSDTPITIPSHRRRHRHRKLTPVVPIRSTLPGGTAATRRGEHLEREIADANVIITTPFWPLYVTPQLLEKGKNLKMILTAGIGSDHIDLKTAAEKNITGTHPYQLVLPRRRRPAAFHSPLRPRRRRRSMPCAAAIVALETLTCH